MKEHWLYLKYVLRHKWYVFVACIKLGVPLHQAIIHDWTKFLPSEWLPYVRWFYGTQPFATRNDRPLGLNLPDSSIRECVKASFDEAWNHHQKRNLHHWQYWLLTMDSGETIALEIPQRFMLEMVADWIGAGKALGNPDTEGWFLTNKNRIRLHDSTRYAVGQAIKRAQRLGLIP